MIEKKKLNKVKIAKFIRYKGSTSKPEIAAELGISMPTVLQNVKELTEAGIVGEIGEYESTGGRKAKTLSITAAWKMAVGLDITLNHISRVALDLKGAITGKRRIKKNFENSFDYYQALAEELDCFLESQGMVLTPFLEISNTEFIIRMIRKNRGISYLPLFAVQEYVKRGELAVLDVADFRLAMYQQVIYNRNKWLTKEMDAFIRITAHNSGAD